ncbi:MAG TPA: hypothetical protein DEG17_02530 [Cyanobacteria bacterium UBA11149]|nr:hypothetical protein [Cyanobacteria bacterium UBA11367]HBE59660.1 hypothetical protein [Cyanobacteria bacterium UBA11366]HBK63144.1 hypothetical protein [Cyanobacteria bacterium UBA11166]HBR74385.1 hypothetical protein [Cyanobacteria bacterium UBA11159]HBS68412.1 hypothetical protein [Cyanobacteria bacterium UBA11153]HBW87783.1 hypothetical protein [Cyanobacteria bacterium UBA11149]HCA96046.1 hypothetical protein [Cyanobacteria bacterium UBA9226]
MNKYSIYLKAMSLALALGMVMTESLSAAVTINNSSQDLSTSSSTLLAQRRGRLGFRVGGIRPSNRRTGGISRGSFLCDGDRITTTALMPQVEAKNEKSGKLEWIPVDATTVESSPKFLVYVSQTKKPTATFILYKEIKDANGKIIDDLVYEENVALTGKSGIVSISVPDDIELEMNQRYHWYFSMECNTVQSPTDTSADASDHSYVEGWVQRIQKDPNLETALKNAGEKGHPAVYSNNELWIETVSSLADLRQRYPNDRLLQDDWQSLLESVGLERVANETLLGSLTVVSHRN